MKISEAIAKELFSLDWDGQPQVPWEEMNEEVRLEYREYVDQFLSIRVAGCRLAIIKEKGELPSTIPILPKFYKQGIITEEDLLSYARLTEIENRMEYIKAHYVQEETDEQKSGS